MRCRHLIILVVIGCFQPPSSYIQATALGQAAPSTQVAANNLPVQAVKPSIIAVGDGLTEAAFSQQHGGWGLLMQEHYVRKADVINRGFGGYYTPWIVKYLLDELFNVANPTMVVLFLGTKDTLTQGVTGVNYISPEEFGRNVDVIMQKAEAAGVKHFLIVTPPPVCEACYNNAPRPWARENAHSQLYVEQLKALAVKHKAGLLNIFEAWQQDPQWADKLLLPDRLHLSPEGNRRLWEQMREAIRSQVPAMAAASLPVHYPLMNVIDKDNPGQAFAKVMRSPSKKALQGHTSSTLDSRTTHTHSSRVSSKFESSRVHVGGSHSLGYAEQGHQQSSSAACDTPRWTCLLLLWSAAAAWRLLGAAA